MEQKELEVKKECRVVAIQHSVKKAKQVQHVSNSR